MMRNEKRNVSDPFDSVGYGSGDTISAGDGNDNSGEHIRLTLFLKSRRWRDGELGLRAANDTAWRRVA